MEGLTKNAFYNSALEVRVFVELLGVGISHGAEGAGVGQPGETR